MRTNPLVSRLGRGLAIAGWLLMLGGCGAIKRSAVRSVADTLSSGDGGVFTRDDDLELVEAAVPFGLKLYESLLETVPDYVPLLVTTCSSFTQYGYAFVQTRAERLEDVDYDAFMRENDRALRLYLRARDYCLQGLDERFGDVRVALLRDPAAALAGAKAGDVPLLYWTAASWGAAVSLGIGRADLAGDLHVVRGLAERALALDEAWNRGALHELMISIESLGEVVGGSEEAAQEHFERATELQQGQQAGPYVALATGIALRNQDRAMFERLLNQALAVDPDAQPATRLPNIVARNRARFLLDRIDVLFPAVPASTHVRHESGRRNPGCVPQEVSSCVN